MRGYVTDYNCEHFNKIADDEKQKMDTFSDSNMRAYICIVSPHDSLALLARITELLTFLL